MFFVDYERFYGIKPPLTGRYSAVIKNDKHTENSTVSNTEDDTHIDKINTTSVAASQLLGNLKSKASGLSENSAAFINSEATADKINAIKNKVKSSAATVSDRFKATEPPKISGISKENPEIKIPENEKENLDYVIEKYIETAGYQPSWKFQNYCGEKLNLDSGSAVKKYRIKVFTFYMRDLLAVISGLYKFDYVKIYEELPMYQDFFINETGNLDTALLVKVSSQIMNKLIEKGILTVNGEGFDTVFTNNTIEQPIEEELLPIKEETKVKPQTETVKQEEQATPHREIPLPQNEFYEPVKKEKTFRTIPVNRNIHRKDTIQIFHDDEPDSFYNSYYVEQTSHSKVIIIIVIILLIPVIIMFGLKLIDYYQKNHSDNFSAVSNKISQASETAETTAVTAVETITTTAETIASPDFTILETDSWASIYSKQLSNYMNSPDYDETVKMGSEYDLFDINGDYIPELFISGGAYHSANCRIYTIIDSKSMLIIDNNFSYGEINIVPSESLIVYSDSSAGHSSLYVLKFSGTYVETLDTFNDNLANSGYELVECNHNGNIVSDEEYINAYNKYCQKNYCTVGRTFSFDRISANELTENYKNRSTDTHAWKERELPQILETTNSNFKGEYLGTGYIHVDSGGLNLRSKPSTDSEVYTVIPNNSSVTIYLSDTSGWYYVEYENYSGYVSSEFVDFSLNLFENDNRNENQINIDPELKTVMEDLEACVDEIVALKEKYGSELRKSNDFEILYTEFRILRVECINAYENVKSSLRQAELDYYADFVNRVTSKFYNAYF